MLEYLTVCNILENVNSINKEKESNKKKTVAFVSQDQSSSTIIESMIHLNAARGAMIRQ